jgi:hypothetical protein
MTVAFALCVVADVEWDEGSHTRRKVHPPSRNGHRFPTFKKRQTRILVGDGLGPTQANLDSMYRQDKDE